MVLAVLEAMNMRQVNMLVNPGSTHNAVVGLVTSGSGLSSIANFGISATKEGDGISLTTLQIIGGGEGGDFYHNPIALSNTI